MRLFEATSADVPRIMECAREFTALLPDCPLNENHYRLFWERELSSKKGIIYLLEHEGVIVGGIGGIASPDLLTGKLSAVELFWYVKPDYRKGLWPIRLLKCFEEWAKLKGCATISMILMEASQPAEMRHFYERAGYSLLETQYRKNL